MGKQHIIELNGKRYDAVTGQIISSTPTPQHPAKTAISNVKKVSIDGFARAVRPLTNNNIAMSGRKVEKSKTLMRKTVKKPEPVKPNSAVKQNPSIQKSTQAVSEHKLAKAKAVPKSSLIKRFSDMSPMPSHKSTATTQPVKTSRMQTVATATTIHADPVAVGLANANSHEQPQAKKPRRHVRVAKRLKISPKVLSASSLALTVLLIGGFFAYQNVPNLNMRVASARAGVQGTLPGYQPAGFSLNGGVSYKPGQITIGYKSNSDDRTFKISQNVSAWNSETLVENYEPLKDSSAYQTVPNKGKTVYIYDGSNATWVDGGIWYRIEGNSRLNSDQLLNLANSM